MKNPIRFLCSAIGGLLLSDAVLAHPVNFNSTITYSGSQPSGAADSIAQWSGAAFDAANIGGSGVNADGGANNGTANDASTRVRDGGQPVQGQTFTTGSNANGYDVSSITVRMAGYTNNMASGANTTSWNLSASNGPIRATIAKINGTAFTVQSIQEFMAGGTGNPGSGNSANGPGTYLTFNLPFPVHLEPDMTYGFDLVIGNGSSNHFEWLGTSSDPYAGGSAYTRGWNGSITPVSGDRVFQLNMTASAAPYAPFTHPGALHTQADFDRMKAKIDAGAAPWKTSYDQLVVSPYAQTNWNPYDVDYINRGGDGANNYTRSQQDAQAIYQLSLRWKLTGNTAYADRAVKIANVWSGLLGISGDSNAYLAVGICGYLFATSGEILSTYPGWPAAEQQAYKDMMMRVFYQGNADFLWRHNGTPGNGGNTHYRLNWDTDNMASMAAIGILCDNRAVYQQAVEYFKNGPGNSRVDRAAWYIHPDGTSQTEESGRDQPHNKGGWYAMGLLCQMAWNQGDDLFGYDNNRVLRAYEYNAKYNNGADVSWVYHRNSDLSYTETLSDNGRYPGGYPSYELIYNHYSNVKGIATPWNKIGMAAIRPEPVTTTAGHPSVQDHLGLGSLTYARDDASSSAAPSGLLAQWSKNQLILNWWGSATATSYEIQRATSESGPYTTLGTATEPNLNFTDTTVVQGGSYYYKVVAITPTGNLESAPLLANQALVASYTFEGNTNDVTGTRDGTPKGTTLPGYAAGFGGGQALSFNGVDQYVQLPVNSGLSRDVTLAAWVYWNGGNAFQRVFDFGSEIEKYMMLTPKDGAGKIGFQMTTSRATDGSIYLTGPTMPVATWTHLAVTFNGETATLYVNGLPVAAGASPRLAPMFSQPFCYLGRSMWNNDPYLNGRIDNFGIYNYGLTGKEVYALWGQGGANTAPAFSVNPIVPSDATEDVNYSGSAQTLAGLATDANGGTLTYSKVSGPAWLAVAGNGALSGTPANANVGENLFVVRVTDSSGATDDANVHLTVINANDAPVWSSSSLTRPAITRDQPYYSGQTLAIDASDVDSAYGDTLTFSKVDGPAWLLVATDGTLSGTPGAADVGTNVVTVRVTDLAGASADATLAITVYPFQQRAGLSLEDNFTDALGNYPATATGSPAFGTGRIGRGLVLDAVDDYLTLPAGIADSQDITIAAWVCWNGGSANQRVFDFGNDTNQYLFLTPSSGSNLRFAIKNGGAEQQLISSALPTGQWVHVAVTLSGDTGRLYVNGSLVATNTAITINPSDFLPTLNYVGKSQWSADPLFNGRIDDFRVYNNALSDSDIAALVDIAPASPLTLAATPRTGRIDLAWGPAQGVQTYTVKRALVSGGPYSVVASGLTATTYGDTTVVNGTPYYYVVSATNAKGESGDSPEAVATPSDLLARITFNENTGASAADSTGNGWNATFVNAPTWTSGFLASAVNLPATASQHLTLPAGIASGLTDFTISTWIKVNAFATWQRIFDFGTGQTNYMFLTTQYTTTAPNNAKLRFGIRSTTAAEQSVSGTNIALVAGAWTHVAITRSGNTVTLYVNGSVAGSGAITINPSALGVTTQNYLGRSQFNDPYLNSALDDFRIYSRAFTAGELAALAHPAAGAPTQLTAIPDDGQAILTWSPNATTTYTVKRATTSGGPYATVASGVSAATYTDTGLSNGITYYYVVGGANADGSGPDSAEASVTPNTLRVHLKFDETSGTLATDSSGHARDATLVNAPVFAAGKFDNALTLVSTSSQYATLPASSVQGLTSVTIMAWVKPTTLTSFTRVFDFGTSAVPNATSGAYLFLSPTIGNVLRFAITSSGYNNEQQISGTAPLAAGAWSHVAVTLNGSVGRLYLNGTQVGINSAMTLTPASLGTLANLYLGKSQFSGDPYLNGALDDFRIYGQALSAAEIAPFAAPLAAPQNLAATPGPLSLNLSWSTVANATRYTVKYATVSGGPYLTLASGLSTPAQLHSGLTYGATYYYVVSAGNSVYDSPFSTELAATPGSAPISEAEAATPAFTITPGSGETPATAALTTAASVPGHSYQLQTTTDLASGPWLDVDDPVLGNGAAIVFETPYDPAEPRRFYRIRISR